MTEMHPLDARLHTAIVGFRESRDLKLLALLRMDGESRLAHDLTVERSDPEAKARVDAALVRLVERYPARTS